MAVKQRELRNLMILLIDFNRGCIRHLTIAHRMTRRSHCLFRRTMAFPRHPSQEGLTLPVQHRGAVHKT